MTENEAIKHLQSYAEVVDNMIKYCKDFEPKADITGYLEKKTVFAMAITALKEIQQYREIGTVEDCREAVEKQKPKKPHRNYKKFSGLWCKCGWYLGQKQCLDIKYCPNCGQAIDENLEGMEDERD